MEPLTQSCLKMHTMDYVVELISTEDEKKTLFSGDSVAECARWLAAHHKGYMQPYEHYVIAARYY